MLTERGYVAVEHLGDTDRVAVGQGLSDLAHDVVCGTLLGDGTLVHQSACLTMSHSEKQAAYAEYKAALLKELAPSIGAFAVAAVAGGERIHQTLQVRTHAHRALGLLRKDFYAPTKQVPPWIAERLNERMLAIWFMDDGHLRARPPRQPRAEIATVCFSDSDIQVLLQGLARLGIAAKALRGRIHLGVAATEKLSRRDSTLRPSIRCGTSFIPMWRRNRHSPENVCVRPCQGDVRCGGGQEITSRERADTTFFCLDVEETRNFVTAGGVVHNCRPPGNRDPLPLEIKNCRSYLYRRSS